MMRLSLMHRLLWASEEPVYPMMFIGSEKT
jgi:hypothetical protein